MDDLRKKLMLESMMRINAAHKQVLPNEKAPPIEISGAVIPGGSSDKAFSGSSNMMLNELSNAYSSPEEMTEDAKQRMLQRMFEEEAKKQMIEEGYVPYRSGEV